MIKEIFLFGRFVMDGVTKPMVGVVEIEEREMLPHTHARNIIYNII